MRRNVVTRRKSTANMDSDGKHFGNKIGGKQGTDACLVVTDDDGDREATST